MEKYKNLIQKIQKHKIIEPPDNLVAGVMEEVGKLETDLLYRLYRFILRRTGPSPEEKSLYFMLVAFAHLTIAVVLLMGLKSIDTRTLLPPLLWWQPWVSLFLACWLVFWGFILKKKTRAGVKTMRAATLFYIEIVVINGVLIFMEFSHILLLIPYITAMVGCCVAAGIFLAFISGSDNRNNMKIIGESSVLT
jgi:hypothetical protein